MIEVQIRGLKKLQRDLKAESRRQKKAMDVAVRVEGFRLMRLLKAEIRAGAPGGRKFAPLSWIARRRLHRGRNEPLRRLALGVRYHLAARDPLQLHIGWAGPRVSRRWKALAQKLQEGFVTPVTAGRRRYMAAVGASFGPRVSRRRYFFIRKSTRLFRTPARPIIDPFWRAHADEAARNIRANFRRKMRGERI